MDNKDIKIIYIGGYGRSGSTLMDIVLSSHPEIEGLGELVNVFDYWQSGEISCFWARVKAEYESKVCLVGDEIEVIRSVENLFSFAIFIPGLNKKKLSRYKLIMTSLFDAIQVETGRSVFVDSSKSAWSCAWRAWSLSKLGFDVSYLHLIRSGYDVVSSVKAGSNKKMEEGLADTGLHWAVCRGSLGWSVANLVGVAYGKIMGSNKYMKIKYSDFIDEPASSVKDIFTWVPVDTSMIQKLCSKTDFFSGNQFSGNRMRTAGKVRIQRPTVSVSNGLNLFDRLVFFVLAGWSQVLIYRK